MRSGLALRRCAQHVSRQPPDHALYVDRHIFVLNKPSGLVCQLSHKNSGSDSPSRHLVHDLVPVFEALQNRFNLNERPYPVHRLDKRTTGALLVARTKQSAGTVSQAFRSHAIQKTYLSLVHDHKRILSVNSSGTVENRLGISSDGRVGITDAPEGKVAKTHWEVMATARLNDASVALLKLQPVTGLKHQLRIHCAKVLGAPILGDRVYGPGLPEHDADRVWQEHGCMALHASSISLPRYRKAGSHRKLVLTVGAPLPLVFGQACGRAGIPLDRDVLEGGVWVDGQTTENGQVPDLEGRWVWDL